MAHLYGLERMSEASCPGLDRLGMEGILRSAVRMAGIPRRKVLLASVLDRSGTGPGESHSCFCAPTGNVLPLASATKVCHPEITVIAEGLDGEVCNHDLGSFLRCIDDDIDITHLLYNNMSHLLGGDNPSSTGETRHRCTLCRYRRPFDPIERALSRGISFAARAHAAHRELLVETLSAALRHPGYALLDILQPCAMYEEMVEDGWLAENTVILPRVCSAGERQSVLRSEREGGRIALGVVHEAPEELEGSSCLRRRPRQPCQGTGADRVDQFPGEAPMRRIASRISSGGESFRR